jgi:predicted nucleic acid-binding protein
VVSDAGPLIHLDELGCLDLLDDISRVAVPVAVRDEVLVHRSIDFARPPLVVVPDPLPDVVIVTASRSLCLHAGERAALALFSAEGAEVFLTDDIAARLAAVQLGYRVHGTLGILLRAFRRRQRSREEVLQLVRDLPVRSSLFIKPNLIERAVTELQSSPD